MTATKNEKNTIVFMDDERYLKERLQKQIDWHNGKADTNKIKYKKFKRIEFILAASIPVIIGISTMSIFESSILFYIAGKVGDQAVNHPVSLSIVMQLLAVVAGVFLAVVNKNLELEEYYKNWKNYRAIEEFLQNQQILYLTQSPPYDDEKAFGTLVSNVEGFLAQEVQKWQKQSLQKKDNDVVKKAQLAVDNQNEFWKQTSIGKNKKKKEQIKKLEKLVETDDLEADDEFSETDSNFETDKNMEPMG